MRNRMEFGASAVALALAASAYCGGALGAALNTDIEARGQIRHVLLISIDGMHALDFANCSGASGGPFTCPTLAALAKTGLTYTNASTSKPSDSFPGLTALATGGSPKSTGAFYDVSYDRALSPPAQTDPLWHPRPPGGLPEDHRHADWLRRGNRHRLHEVSTPAGASIPTICLAIRSNACTPVYPHNFIRVNTMFEVVHDSGGYTAWSDKHQSYELTKGMSGTGVDDFYAPEINSIPVPLPQVTSMKCNPLPDQTAVSSSNAWTDSFKNIQCYDSLKVQAIINEIDGLDHTGAARTHVPNVFGMNFQAVSVGQKLVEASVSTTGGYKDSIGTPSPALEDEIKFVDSSIGAMVKELKKKNLLDTTTIIVTAKHGQSPIDPNRVLRIPADRLTPRRRRPRSSTPAPVQALEDDVSLLWLENHTAGVPAALAALEANAAKIGADGGEFFSGPSLGLMFDVSDSRTPDIIVAPNVGVIYTGHKAKVAEHGGFAHDDTNVIMLASNPNYKQRSINAIVQTAQVAPTILSILGLDPQALIAVRNEGTEVLPGF